MRVTAIAPLLLLLVGCSSAAQETVKPPEQFEEVAPIVAAPQRRRLEVRVNLSHPDDLKVVEGDEVVEGDVLADRTRDREELLARKEILLIQQEKLSQPLPPVTPAREVAPLPDLPPDQFIDEIATVERRRLGVESAERAVQQQQRMLDLLQGMEEANLPQATIPHELEVLRQRNDELSQAIADLQLAEALLDQAQTTRAYDEYNHSVRQSERALQMQQVEVERQRQTQQRAQAEQNRALSLSELEIKLVQIDTQLAEMGIIKAPWAAIVQRVKWDSQNDQNLQVELTLIESFNGDGSDAIDLDGIESDINPSSSGQ